MKPEELEKIMDKIGDIYELLSVERKAIGFVADRIQDDQASANLQLIEHEMERIENMLNRIHGKPEKYVHDVPQ